MGQRTKGNRRTDHGVVTVVVHPLHEDIPDAGLAGQPEMAPVLVEDPVAIVKHKAPFAGDRLK